MVLGSLPEDMLGIFLSDMAQIWDVTVKFLSTGTERSILHPFQQYFSRIRAMRC